MRTTLLISLNLYFGTLYASEKDSIAVANSVSAFVTAFNNFDWPAFHTSFDEDASIFHPTWENARRIRGKREIEATWLSIFPEFSDTKNTSKLNIDPREINIQIYGSTAIVTFHLGDGAKVLSRRTIVMAHKNDGWKIVHVHASRLNKDD